MGISNKLSDKRLRRTVSIIAACYKKALYKNDVDECPIS